MCNSTLNNERQFDIPLTTQYHYIIPTSVKGRLTKEDFIHFTFCDFNPSGYNVLLESYNGQLLKIGPLSETVRLPHVQIPRDNLIWIIHSTNEFFPKFVGTAQRGKTYNVSLKGNKFDEYNLLQ